MMELDRTLAGLLWLRGKTTCFACSGCGMEHILSTTLTMNNVANVLFGDVMGKTVFLTREEAEAALAQKGGKNE